MRILILIVATITLFVSCSKKAEIAQKEESESPKKESVIKEKSPQKEIKTVAKTESSLSVSEQWNRYNKTRGEAKKAHHNKRFDESAQLYNLAAQYATELGRPGIASWQYNSAGKELINDFKERVDYAGIMQKMNKLKDKKEREKLSKEMKKQFAKEFARLKPAQEYLLLAEDADSHHSKKNGNKGKRLSLIKSNLSFIEWVDGFTKELR